jgi:hypothetical protein
MRVLRLFRAVGLAFSMAVATVLAAAAGELSGPITGLDARIHSVTSGGYWSDDDNEGFFRAVVAAEGVETTSHNLYLQWLAVDLDKGTYAVLSTSSVDEVNADRADGGVIAVAMDAAAEFGTLRLVVTVTRPRTEVKTRYTLTADGVIGAYRLTMAK